MAPVWLVPAAGAERAMSPVSPRAGSPALGSLERTRRAVPTAGQGVTCSRVTSRSFSEPSRWSSASIASGEMEPPVGTSHASTRRRYSRARPSMLLRSSDRSIALPPPASVPADPARRAPSASAPAPTFRTGTSPWTPSGSRAAGPPRRRSGRCAGRSVRPRTAEPHLPDADTIGRREVELVAGPDVERRVPGIEVPDGQGTILRGRVAVGQDSVPQSGFPCLPAPRLGVADEELLVAGETIDLRGRLAPEGLVERIVGRGEAGQVGDVLTQGLLAVHR